MAITAQTLPSAPKDTVVTQELKEVIVTATRTARQLSALPLPAQIVGKQEIREIHAQRLSDLLNEQTGLTLVSDFGGGKGIQLQGLDAQYTLILIDGMPLTGRSAGTLDLDRISVGNGKQIEIVKGASSSLYGSEALGGVINIITDTPEEGFGGNLSHRSGSFNAHDTGLTLAYKKNKTSISAFVNRFSSNGFDLNANNMFNTVDTYRNYTFNAKVKYEMTEKTTITLSGRYFTQNQDDAASETVKGESDTREWSSYVKLSRSHHPRWNSYVELYATRYRAEAYLDNPDATRFSESYYDQVLVRPELRTVYTSQKKNVLTAGLGWNYETLDRTDFSIRPEFHSPYLYLQYDARLNEKINLLLGGRFDHHSQYTSQFSPKAAVSYKAGDKIVMRGSIGYGFKTPDFRQLYFNFTNATVGYTILGYHAVRTVLPELEAEGQLLNIIVPLSDFEDRLKPENSVAVNIGVDYTPVSTLTLHLNIFRNHVKDLIDTRLIATKINGQSVFSYYNVHKVYTGGLELNTSWSPSNRIKFSGGFQLLYARDKAAEKEFEAGKVFAKENPGSPAFQLQRNDYFGLYNRSRYMANFKVFYTMPRWKLRANLRMTYRSRYGLSDSNGNLYLDRYDDFVNGYSIWDIALNKNFTKDILLGFGIENAFDFSDPQYISHLPGRIIYGKFTLSF